MGVVVRRYIDFLILLIPTPLVYALFCSNIPTFCSFKKMFFVHVPVSQDMASSRAGAPGATGLRVRPPPGRTCTRAEAPPLG